MQRKEGEVMERKEGQAVVTEGRGKGNSCRGRKEKRGEGKMVRLMMREGRGKRKSCRWKTGTRGNGNRSGLNG